MAARRYEGTTDYVASPALRSAVEAALTLERPLLVRGEPGTGKTLLADSVARALGMELVVWSIKSTTKAKDGLYVYDVVRRLNDSRFGTPEQVANVERYIDMGPLGRAFSAPKRFCVLIDEVDKADVEFPNDLLHEIDRMEFEVTETGRRVKAQERPVVIITSNAEKELPDAFLRRCVFHYIEFPDPKLMTEIVRVHFPDLDQKMLKAALEQFYKLRERDGVRKKPSTSELIDWLLVLLRGGVSAEDLGREVPFLGVLLKKEQDVELVRQGGRFRHN
ncbi:MoxR family ATPase [bacterium]|nr:MoxR family ATPase [bacterium]